MNACLSDFRVVNPTLRTFSAAEARIAQSSIRFNNLRRRKEIIADTAQNGSD